MTGDQTDLGRRVAALAADVPTAQEWFDTAHMADLAHLKSIVEQLDLTDPQIAALLPPRMLFDSVTIDVEMTLEERRAIGGSLGLSLLTRPVHTFLHSRFGVSRTDSCRVSITVGTVPAPPATVPTMPKTNDQ